MARTMGHPGVTRRATGRGLLTDTEDTMETTRRREHRRDRHARRLGQYAIELASILDELLYRGIDLHDLYRAHRRAA